MKRCTRKQCRRLQATYKTEYSMLISTYQFSDTNRCLSYLTQYASQLKMIIQIFHISVDTWITFKYSIRQTLSILVSFTHNIKSFMKSIEYWTCSIKARHTNMWNMELTFWSLREQESFKLKMFILHFWLQKLLYNIELASLYAHPCIQINIKIYYGEKMLYSTNNIVYYSHISKYSTSFLW